MVNFLILINKIIDFSKKDIDKGNTPPEIYKICSSLRTTFCLSYNIRKNNNLYLYFQENKILIKFEGDKLRYLGPDERSQALLLKKALDKINQPIILDNPDWIKSTPGIYIKLFNNNQAFILWLKLLELKHIVCIPDSISIWEFPFLAHTYDFLKIKKFSSLDNLEELFFIISLNFQNKSPLVQFIYSLIEVYPSLLEHTILTPLNNIITIEDKILYINFQIDQRKTIKNLEI